MCVFKSKGFGACGRICALCGRIGSSTAMSGAHAKLIIVMCVCTNGGVCGADTLYTPNTPCRTGRTYVYLNRVPDVRACRVRANAMIYIIISYFRRNSRAHRNENKLDDRPPVEPPHHHHHHHQQQHHYHQHHQQHHHHNHRAYIVSVWSVLHAGTRTHGTLANTRTRTRSRSRSRTRTRTHSHPYSRTTIACANHLETGARAIRSPETRGHSTHPSRCARPRSQQAHTRRSSVARLCVRACGYLATVRCAISGRCERASVRVCVCVCGSRLI